MKTNLKKLRLRYIKEGYKKALKENTFRKVFDYDEFSDALAEVFVKKFINYAPDVELQKYVDGNIRDHENEAAKAYFEATQDQIKKVLQSLPDKILAALEKAANKEKASNASTAEINKRWAERDAEIQQKAQKSKEDFERFMRGSSRFRDTNPY